MHVHFDGFVVDHVCVVVDFQRLNFLEDTGKSVIFASSKETCKKVFGNPEKQIMRQAGTYDVVVVGSGIVGLASAWRILQREPGLSLALIDKEERIAAHQTSHNSGVIHSGIYYKPGGSKALNCRRGHAMMVAFCEEHGVPYELCGKVIVATREEELPRLKDIYQRGLANGLEGIEMLTAAEVREYEPHVAALKGIWVPQAGIVDYARVAQKLMELIEAAGGAFLGGHALQAVSFGESRDKNLHLKTSAGELASRYLITAAGLYADKVARMTGMEPRMKIIPFRGEYYRLVKEKEKLVNNLIYPVPNPDFPFLGVHYTRMMKGGIEAGPNAVLAFAREGYSRWKVHFSELAEVLTYRGFLRLAAKYYRVGWDELHRSYSKRAFVNALRHLIPEVGYEDLERSGAGVRAQAIAPDGSMVNEFVVLENERIIHVLNAPSPAATSSLSIGQDVADKLFSKMV